MIVEFRAAVADVCVQHFGTTVPVLDELPDDLSQLPTIVVGRADAGEGDAPIVADLSTDLWLIARRSTVDRPGLELDTLADEVLSIFHAWRSVRHEPSQLDLMATSLVARTLDVGGARYSAYTVTIETSVTTC